MNKKRALINIFVHSIYLYDDYFDIVLNGSNHRLNVNDVPIEKIEYNANKNQSNIGSTTTSSAPPNNN